MRKRWNKQHGFGMVEVLIIVAIAIVIGLIGWRVWEVNKESADDPQQKNTQGADTTNDTAKKSNAFKIPELNVEFDVKDGVTPLYSISDKSWNNVNYKLIYFSTQQLVDRGASSTSLNPCDFRTAEGKVGFSLMTVSVYNSLNELIEVESDPRVTINFSAENIKPESGYLTVGNQLYHVPQQIQAGSGLCSDSPDFESQQRVLLRNSLQSLRSTAD